VVRNGSTKRGGFGRGETFDESCRERSAACVNERAFRALDELREPFFLYLHYLEPHQPYQPPKWHQRRFATARPTARWVRIGDPHPIGRQLYDGEPGPAFGQSEVRHLVDLYDDEIAFFDARFAELLADLERRGVAGAPRSCWSPTTARRSSTTATSAIAATWCTRACCARRW
jgi:arylsulfatase A-like enzyme